MADYTTSKSGSRPWPENAIADEHSHLEPLLGAKELRSRHLFGIPLFSQIPDPRTGKPMEFTDPMLEDIIEGAVTQAEEDCHIDIWPVQRDEKYPFDRNLYESFGYFQLEHRPVTSIEHVAVTPANGVDVYSVPLEWVETSYLPRGQLNIIPMTASFVQGGFVPAGTSGGAFFLAVMNNTFWVPAYWKLRYTSGFKDGMMPRYLNELIGTIAAQEVLSQLAATYARVQSSSLGIDGLSQSVSTPGPGIFQVRIEDLEKKKTKLVKKVKARFGRSIFSSHT